MTAQTAPASSHSRRGAGRSRNEAKSKGNEPGKGGRDKDKAQNDKASESAKSETTRSAKPKPQNEGEKLVVRRLPPAMTEAEFLSIIGQEWEVNRGKVDWYRYAPGKTSKDPSKPSRASRAYFHLIRKDDIMLLSDVVRAANWEDAKGSFNDPVLIAPPGVEFAIYKKYPTNKKRNDARQGTIDQDPQFMAFLEELANPTVHRETPEGGENGEDADKLEVKITTTPLIEYLKEKKANKGKEASAKSAKGSKVEAKAKGGVAGKDEETATPKKKGKGGKEKEEKTKPLKENVKILTKKTATEQAAEAAKNVASQINSATAAAAAAATSTTSGSAASSTTAADAAPKTRRAGIAAAARLLQRDLGLSPGSAHRRARQDAAKAEGTAKTSEEKDVSGTSGSAAASSTPTNERPTSPVPSESSQTSKGVATGSASPKSGRRNRGGKGSEKNKAASAEPSNAQPAAAAPKPMMILKKSDSTTGPQAKDEPSKASQPSSNPSPAPNNTKPATPAKGKSALSPAQQPKKKATPAAVSADATQAFIKHANPSQGVDDAALRQALGVFGTITSVEVDRRKGFAFVDFSDHETLVRAIQASPVAVGQTTVQVLERKDKKPAGGASANNTNAQPAASAGNSSNPEKSEKPSGGRGRRGRGGGGNKASGGGGGEKAQAAPQQPAANPGG